MRRGESDYEWAKRRVRALFSDVESWTNDSGLVYEKDDVWTVKKLLAIDGYIEPFCRIARRHFPRWVYVDFFAGPGLMRFASDKFKKKHLCKGSPLIPLFISDKFPFKEYFFFDSDETRTQLLAQRIDRMREEARVNSSVTIHPPEALEFQHAASKLYGKAGMIRNRPLSLVVIDPEGYEGVPWESVSEVLTNGRVDLIFTFMTFGIIRNKNRVSEEGDSVLSRNLDVFFGDRGWRKIENDKIVDYYCNKIRSLGYKVRTIPVHEKGERKVYDIILASKDDTVEKIFGQLKARLDELTSEMLGDAIGVNQKESYDLDTFL